MRRSCDRTSRVRRATNILPYRCCSHSRNDGLTKIMCHPSFLDYESETSPMRIRHVCSGLNCSVGVNTYSLTARSPHGRKICCYIRAEQGETKMLRTVGSMV